MKKNAILTSVIATSCSLSLNTATDAMGGFEDDLGNVNFHIGGKSIGDQFQVSNPPTTQIAGPITSADGTAPTAEQVGTATYTIPATGAGEANVGKGNILGNTIELDLEAQTQFGLDFDYKVDAYNLPFNIALGYFTASGQTVDDTFTQRLQAVTASTPTGGSKDSVIAKATDDTTTTTLKPEAESRSSELRIGARKYKDFDNGISIFYGFGLASMNYEIEGKYAKNGVQGVTLATGGTEVRKAAAATLVDFSESASTIGFYGELATLYKVSQQFHVGGKLALSSGSVDIENPLTGKEESTQIGGMQYSLFAGMSF
jgi:hypothetical protein